MPFERFNILGNADETLQLWKRKLEFLLNKNLNSDNVLSTSLTLGSAQVKASNIDFGTGANQVDASDIPIVDASSYFSGATVELALAQLGSTILNLPSSYLDVSFVTPLATSSTNVVLNYSTHNFKVNASSKLDTIQNIGTTDAVTFDSVTATSNVQGLTGKFGNVSTGNYTEFESDGTMVFRGNATVFRDELQSLLLQNYVTPAADIVLNSSEGTLEFKQACTLSDYVTMNVQINHDWKYESLMYPHLHWWQGTSDVPNWLVQYRWQENGHAVSTSWAYLPWNSNAFTWASGTLNQITGFAGIKPSTNAGVSTILQLRLLRDGDNDSSQFGTTDLVTGVVSALNFDVHIEIDTVGSRTEYSK